MGLFYLVEIGDTIEKYVYPQSIMGKTVEAKKHIAITVKIVLFWK